MVLEFLLETVEMEEVHRGIQGMEFYQVQEVEVQGLILTLSEATVLQG